MANGDTNLQTPQVDEDQLKLDVQQQLADGVPKEQIKEYINSVRSGTPPEPVDTDVDTTVTETDVDTEDTDTEKPKETKVDEDTLKYNVQRLLAN